MLAPINGRTELGTFAAGNLAAPNGCKGNSIFSKAALDKMFDAMLGENTFDQIIALNADPIAKGKLSTAKAMILARIIDSLESGGGQDFDRVMDRRYGKPSGDMTQVNVQVNNITKIERVIVDAKGGDD